MGFRASHRLRRTSERERSSKPTSSCIIIIIIIISTAENSSRTAESFQRWRAQQLPADVSQKPPDVVFRLYQQRVVQTVFPGQPVSSGVLATAPTQGPEHFRAVCRVRAPARVCGHKLEQHTLQGARERTGQGFRGALQSHPGGRTFRRPSRRYRLQSSRQQQRSELWLHRLGGWTGRRQSQYWAQGTLARWQQRRQRMQYL